MRHLEEYNRIIEFRKSNPLPDGQYGEDHHIKPRSIYPELVDDKANIVRLSAQEHFLAHYHLWLAYRDELNQKRYARKMCYAFLMMKRAMTKCEDVELMAKLYEEVKVAFAIDQSKKMKGNNYRRGKKHTQQTKKKISEKNKGQGAGRRLSNTTRYKISVANKGKHLSEETKMKLSEKNKGHKLSDEARQKISNNLKGNKYTFGMKWFNNGSKSVMAKSCPDGFVAGRLKRL